MAYRLYLPQEWAKNSDRLRKVGVPKDIGFKTKHEIALEQLRWACAAGLPRGVALMDAGYSNNSNLRADITSLGLSYVAGILSNTTVWADRTAAAEAMVWPWTAAKAPATRRQALHGLVAELAERGLTVDYRSIWEFVHAEQLSFNKTVAASERDLIRTSRGAGRSGQSIKTASGGL